MRAIDNTLPDMTKIERQRASYEIRDKKYVLLDWPVPVNIPDHVLEQSSTEWVGAYVIPVNDKDIPNGSIELAIWRNLRWFQQTHEPDAIFDMSGLAGRTDTDIPNIVNTRDKTPLYHFRICIGDWSQDGHGQSMTYLVKSNKPVEDVREAHFRINAKTGIDIETICSNYMDNTVNEYDFKKLKELGFEFLDLTGLGEDVVIPSDMFRLWLFLLQKADPELKLEPQDDDIPSLHFYGYDAKDRHIGFVGYGTFHD